MDAALTTSAAATPQDSYGGNMTVLDMLDRAFRIYRKNFVPFLAMTAAIAVPTAIAGIPLAIAQQRAPFADSTASLQVLVGSFNILILLIQVIVVQTMTTYMASELFMGNEVTLGQAFKNSRPRFMPVAGAAILLGVIIGVGYFTSALLTVACFVGIVGLIFMVYFSSAISYFLMPVLTLEDVNSVDGINRAWYLGKKRFWRGLSLLTLTSLISLTFYLSLGIVAELAYNPLISSGYEDFVAALRVVVNNIITIAITPLQFIALTVFYYDTRVRLESMDVSFYLSRYKQPRPRDIPSPKPSGGVLNGRDLLNMLIMVVGVTAVVLVFMGIAYAFAYSVGAV